MPLSELFIFGILGSLIWLWFDGTAAREAGVAAVRKACLADGLQLLDETIAIRSLRLKRCVDGRLGLYRIYEFEYSQTGDDRRRGSIHLFGRTPAIINVGAPPTSADSPTPLLRIGK